MYEEHRKYSRCILCRMQGVTREHIFGKTLAEKLAVNVPWTAASQSTKRELHGLPLKGTSPITHIAPKVLCGDCNNKRLSGLMNASLPILLSCIGGECSHISRSKCQILRRYLERIAVIVDVATSDHEVSAKRRASKEFQLIDKNRVAAPAISQEVRTGWLDGASLSQVRIFIGNHEGVLGLNPDMCITHCRLRTMPHGDIVHNAKRVSIAIGKLAVCIDIHLHPSDVPRSFVPLESADITWPPAAEASYEDYLSLRDQDPDVRHFRTILAHPRTRREIESLSRVAGYLKFPFDVSW